MAVNAIGDYLAGGEISGQIDEDYWRDQARPYLEAIEDVGLMVVWRDGRRDA